MRRRVSSDLRPAAPVDDCVLWLGLVVDPDPAAAGIALRTDPLARPDPVEGRLATTLQHVMADDRACRTEDLTVAGLGARLAVPEYGLRRLINPRLGHRNFHAFVNSCRLDEAGTALADPKRRELPVLAIALDTGDQSIGSLNRAFKTATGLTPTGCRPEEPADS